jgi:hypothetical protein
VQPNKVAAELHRVAGHLAQRKGAAEGALAGQRELAAAEREREKHDQFAIEQPETAPELAVGMKIEVLTQLQQTTEKDELKFYNQWLAATVLQASTGEQKRPDKTVG